MDPRGTTDSRSRGAGKRWLFSLVLLLLLYGSVEGGASLALWYLDGASFSLERLDRERSERSTEQAAVATPERPDQRPWWMKSEILHPYLGFVINPALRKAAPHPISDFGFIDVAAPLHRRAEDRLIVGIFGGSVAQSFQSEGTDTLAELLTGSDAFAGREVVFVRTALSDRPEFGRRVRAKTQTPRQASWTTRFLLHEGLPGSSPTRCRADGGRNR